jgi:hypothetical protein
MPKEKSHFMGILANVDSSILNVKLDHGFKIEAQSEDELVNLISNFENALSKSLR